MISTNDAIRLKAVNHVTYNCTDKDRALRFWEDVLGIKQIPKQVNVEHLYWLQIPSGTMVHLIEHADGASAPSHHAAFEVDDIEAAQSISERTRESRPRTSAPATTGREHSTSTTPRATA